MPPRGLARFGVFLVAALTVGGALAGPAGGPARLVKDINTLPEGDTGSFPGPMVALGEVMLLRAFTPEAGEELWRSDGSEEGTELVKDIWPGPVGGLRNQTRFSSRTQSDFVPVGQMVFFVADDGMHGAELWVTDGTGQGTRMVQDIRPGGEGAFDIDVYDQTFATSVAGGLLFFIAQDGVHGYELWRSDGSAAGTFPLRGGMAPIVSSVVGSMQAIGVEMAGSLYLMASDATHGSELWVTDGSEAGTRLVKDIQAGSGGSSPGGFKEYDGVLYFAATASGTDNELWRSDGTTAGTFLVKDLIPGSFGSSPRNLTVANGLLFLTSYQHLWRSDGTADGTILLKAFSSGGITVHGAFLESLILSADTQPEGRALWRSDGTPAGTVLLKDINPAGTTLRLGGSFIEHEGRLYFGADDGVHGLELWVSDGSEAGTILFANLEPGPAGSSPSILGVTSGRLLIRTVGATGTQSLWGMDAATGQLELLMDGYYGMPTFAADSTAFMPGWDSIHGLELWRTDGTRPGTLLVRDINTNIHTQRSVQEILGAISLPGRGDVVFMNADDGTQGEELWLSDGSGPGTVLVKDIRPGMLSSSPRSAALLDGAVIFSADDGIIGREPWRSDGTEMGTYPLADICPGPCSSMAHSLPTVAADGGAYFAAGDGVEPSLLWRTDGTVAGTVSMGSGRPIGALGGRLLFVSPDVPGEASLWRTDGTSGRATLLRVFQEGIVQPLGQGESGLVFTADDGVHGAEPWLTDGTPEGTILLGDIEPGPARSFHIGPAVELAGSFYLPAFRQNLGWEPWHLDGSSAGTYPVRDIRPGSPGSSPSDLTPFEGAVLFGASTPSGGARQLWSSDGTEAGTIILKDGFIWGPYSLRSVGDGVIMAAADDGYGSELWRTDGTTDGTVLVQDLNPGPPGSYLAQFTPAGSRLFFVADDYIAGAELWVARTSIVLGRADLGLRDLRAEIVALGLKQGQERSLTAKLDAAARALKSGDDVGALDSLQEFMKHVEVMTPAKLQASVASGLVEFAEEIVGLITP